MPDLLTRLHGWAAARRLRVGGVNPLVLVIASVQRFNEVRVTGLAAEMTYYALVSLIPFVLALGAGIGLLGLFIDSTQIALLENAVVLALGQVFSPDAMRDVIEPLVRGLLTEARAGTALLSLFVTFLLASAVFRAVIRVLDDAYGVPERRGMVTTWGRAYLLSLASVVVIVTSLSFIVIGPLLGGGYVIAGWLGLGDTFAMVWAVGRWPAVLALGIAFLAWLYTFGPNVRASWKSALPGATLAALGTVLIAMGLRFYLAVAGPRAPTVGDAEEVVAVASQTIGALLAVVLWLYLTSMAVLTGGVVNAELHRLRGERVVVEDAG